MGLVRHSALIVRRSAKYIEKSWPIERFVLCLPVNHPAAVRFNTTITSGVTRSNSQGQAGDKLHAPHTMPYRSSTRAFCTGSSLLRGKFDESMLKILVCPLTKKPLRYDKEKNELISDDIGVAYPIMEDGIPNLVPQDARKLNGTDNTDQTKT